MVEKTKLATLYEMPILREVSTNTLQTIARFSLVYPARNSRYRPQPGELALLLDGRARVCRREGNKIILLNRLQKGDCVGLASLYSDTLPDTEVTFSAGAALLVIPRYELEGLIMEDAMLCRNIIALLSQKVRFLNSKIAGYTASGSGEKLYRHLLTLPKAEDGTIVLGESMASLARRLGIGRASLYRAVDALLSEGKIEKDGQSIRLLPMENKEEIL